MMKGRARLLLAAAALGAALAGFWLAQQLDRASPRLASGSWLPQAKAVADFQLTDSDGQPFTRHDLAGTPTLVFFGFTRCPDVCPGTLFKLAQLRKRTPLRVLFVSIDPEYDNPARLAMYLHAFDPAFRGLTGEPAAIRKVAAGFAAAGERVALPGGEYTMDHSAVVFLLDAAARIAAVFTPPFDVAALSADLARAAPHLSAGRTAASARPAS